MCHYLFYQHTSHKDQWKMCHLNQNVPHDFNYWVHFTEEQDFLLQHHLIYQPKANQTDHKE